MRAAGYVLAGGRSTRMGRDKALLPWNDRPLLVHMLSLVESATGTAIVLGSHTRYSAICDAVCWDDLRPGLGPMGGLETALTRTQADWNLVVSIDTPGVKPATLEALVHVASRTIAEVIVVCDSPSADHVAGQVHPLCAIYHRRCLSAVEDSIRQGDLRVMSLLKRLKTEHLELPAPLKNLNSLEDWRRATTVTP